MSSALFMDYPAFPSAAPADHARIVNLATYNENKDASNENVKLPDAAVTMMEHIFVDGTNALARFLEPNRMFFRLVQQFKDYPRNPAVFVIERQYNVVLVSDVRVDIIRVSKVMRLSPDCSR